MTGRVGRRTWRPVVVVAASAALLSAPASAAFGPWWSSSPDLVASAQPTEQHPVVSDEAETVVRVLPHRRNEADVVATSSATCPGCHGSARTVQIVDGALASRLDVDNVAAAWASCADCSSDALSVQVVLTRGGEILVANNRSMAVSAACSGCETTAAAYQVVLTTHGWTDLRALQREVEAWVDSWADPLARGPSPDGGASERRGLLPRRGADSVGTLDELERLVVDHAGGVVREASVDRDSGG